MKENWKNVTILGLSLSGISAAKYLSSKGINCTISELRSQNSEDNEKIQELNKLGIRVEMGFHNEKTLLGSDLIITSPGIPPHFEVINFIKNNDIPLIGEIELAHIETGKPFIAITGTNGKTTTTKLISEILTNEGYNAPACGNIGVPPTSLLGNNIDYFVAEVSSFQIFTSPSFKPKIAVFLNFAPDHIDWHGTEEAYYQAKALLFKSACWSVLNACDYKVMELKNKTSSQIFCFGKELSDLAVYIQDNFIVYKNRRKVEKIIELENIRLLGQHNLENIMAAIAVAIIVGVSINTIKSSIIHFKLPEHRIEYVDTIDGIAYYNDSKATNCSSTICALQSFQDNKVVLIAGGRDKETDLTELIRCIKNHVASVILIGEATDRFEKCLVMNNYTNIYKTTNLEEAIDISYSLKLGIVLLSPACSSHDMFKNFEDRGNAFKTYVRQKKITHYNSKNVLTL